MPSQYYWGLDRGPGGPGGPRGPGTDTAGEACCPSSQAENSQTQQEGCDGGGQVIKAGEADQVGQTISGGNRKGEVSRHARKGRQNKTGNTITQAINPEK